MDSKWKNFETLVAAINKIAHKGADVKWNEEIDGRQFDVSIRFKYGLYEYLTLIECKQHRKPIPVTEIEAFITKSKDAGANKAIIVSESGFQKGAINVAKKHDIELFSLIEATELPEETIVKGLAPLINVKNIRLLNGKKILIRALPKESNITEYYINKVLFLSDSGVQIPLKKILDKWCAENFNVISERISKIHINLLPEEKIIYPFEDENISAEILEFEVNIITGKIVEWDGRDPSVYPKSWVYENILTGETQTFGSRSNGLKFETQFVPHRFYHSPKMGFNYYCERIEQNVATLILVESFQHGMLIQAELFIDVKYSVEYVEIEDQKEIKRLLNMYQKFKSKQRAARNG